MSKNIGKAIGLAVAAGVSFIAGVAIAEKRDRKSSK